MAISILKGIYPSLKQALYCVQESGSCRQNKGDLSQNSAVPFTSPETKRTLLVSTGDFSFWLFVMFSNPNVYYSLLCFTESFSPVLSLPFLSPAPPFASPSSPYNSHPWRFSHEFSLFLYPPDFFPSPTNKPWSTSTPFLVCTCFCLWKHFSHLCPPSKPSSPCLPSRSSCYCMPLILLLTAIPTSCCFCFLALLCHPCHIWKEYSQQKNLSGLFHFWCLQTWILLSDIFSAKVLYFLHSPHVGAKCSGLMLPSPGGESTDSFSSFLLHWCYLSLSFYLSPPI